MRKTQAEEDSYAHKNIWLMVQVPVRGAVVYLFISFKKDPTKIKTSKVSELKACHFLVIKKKKNPICFVLICNRDTDELCHKVHIKCVKAAAHSLRGSGEEWVWRLHLQLITKIIRHMHLPLSASPALLTLLSDNPTAPCAGMRSSKCTRRI